MAKDDDKLNTARASNPLAAWLDVRRRTQEAYEENDFFSTKAHRKRISDVRHILEAFFPYWKEIYINHRANKGKPFSVIKIDSPKWERMSLDEKKRRLYDPLEALGNIEIKISGASNSTLFRIY